MEADFTIEEVIALMKKTKKTDPLFKPLKKLKTALEVSSYPARVSDLPQSPFFRLKESWFFISGWETK
jgi:hypothetical protein